MRIYRLLILAALLLVCTSFGMAQRSGPTISWTPSQLASGSPALLRAEFTAPPASVSGEWFGHSVEFFPSSNKKLWYALAGADVETAPGSYPLTLHATTASGKTSDASHEIPIGPAHYKQVELRVPERFVSPDPATLQRIAAEKELKAKVFSYSAAEPLWHGDFLLPVKSPPTDSFGTRRVFNGELASIHRGMDFRARSGTPVFSANAGTVILARPLFYEGNCIVIDHGQGFTTIYMHLSKIQVHEGEKVKMHQHLGLSGATGRATGPHLHFAARWQGAYLDPALLFKLNLPQQAGIRQPAP